MILFAKKCEYLIYIFLIFFPLSLHAGASNIDGSKDEAVAKVYMFVGVLFILLYLIPSIIAFFREHHYKWIILVINIILGATGAGWLVAFVWAVWPKNTSFADVVLNDPTTNSTEAGKEIYGKMGSNFRSLQDELKREPNLSPVYANDDDLAKLRQLASLKEDGIITEEEFLHKKRAILKMPSV